MKISKIILGVFFLLIIAGGVVFFNRSSLVNKKNDINLDSKTVKNNQSENKKNRIQDNNKNKKNTNSEDFFNKGAFCQSEKDNSQSLLYFKGNNLKIISKEGKNQFNALIINQKDVYYWEEGAGEGFKFTYQIKNKNNQSETKKNNLSGTMFNFSFDSLKPDQTLNEFEKAISGKCQAQEISDSVFELPKNVRFSDFGNF